MATAFQANLAPLDIVKGFYRLAATPEQVASVMLRTVGRLPVRDQAGLGVLLRLLFRVLDVNWFLAMLIAVMPWTPDWRKHPDLH